MFESMDISESIHEGVVEPSFPPVGKIPTVLAIAGLR